MEPLEPRRLYTGTVEGYNSEGAGVVRLDGRVVFITEAVRGETIEFALIREGKNAAVGKLSRIRTPSSNRCTPDCPLYGQCGGCDFRHLTYEEELWAKRRRVQDALRRIGGAEVEVELLSVPEEETAADAAEESLPAVLARPLRYRNKIQFPVSKTGEIGFYRAGSHTVVETADCLLQSETASRTADAVREWMRRYQIPGYDERTGRGLIRHLYVRLNRAGESVCCIVANGKTLPREPELAGLVRAAAPETVGLVLNVHTKPGNVVLGNRYRTIWGRDFLLDSLCGLEFRVSLPSFFQVNRTAAEILYQKALDYAALTGRETALDLYCGIGTITLCLARRAGRAIGAEVVERAVGDARENAARNGFSNAEFFCADASEAAARFLTEGLRPEVVTVDPPRKGLTPEGIAAIAAMGPDRVVYVSCDPGTLGRDVKRFAEAGYRAARAAAVDMFPGTRHVETVVLLSQQKPDDRIVVDLNLDDLDTTSAEAKATYAEIKAWVWEHHGLKVSSLYISQVKRKCGLEVGKNYNVSKSDNPKVPVCPKAKEDAIMEALRFFHMILK